MTKVTRKEAVDISSIAENYLLARQELEAIEKRKSELEEALKSAFMANDYDTFIVAGKRIALVQGERPKYDAALLAELVSPATLKKVTKLEIDGKKFKAGIEVGLISGDVADAVTTTTPYTQLRVTVAAGNDEVAKATTKVA